MAVGRLGAWSDSTDSTVVVKSIAREVQAQAEGKTNHKYLEFHAVNYRTQTVVGTNYLIKVRVGLDDYVHLRVHQKLPCNGGEAVLVSVQENHKEDDPLTPFL